MPSALWQTHDYWLNRFDTRNMIGWSAKATTDSKFGLPVVEIGFICIYYERPWWSLVLWLLGSNITRLHQPKTKSMWEYASSHSERSGRRILNTDKFSKNLPGVKTLPQNKSETFLCAQNRQHRKRGLIISCVDSGTSEKLLTIVRPASPWFRWRPII